MVCPSASCPRDGLRLKSKEGRESRTLEDMLGFTKVPALCLSFPICKMVVRAWEQTALS